MSNYGRIWQRASDVRDKLKELMPGIPVNRHRDTVVYLQGRVDVTREVDALMVKWARLEREMEMCDD